MTAFQATGFHTSSFPSTSIGAQYHQRLTPCYSSLLHLRALVPRCLILADSVYHLLAVHDDLRPVNLRPYHCDRTSTRRPRPTKEPGYGLVDTGDRGHLAERRLPGCELSSSIQSGLSYALSLCRTFYQQRLQALVFRFPPITSCFESLGGIFGPVPCEIVANTP
ncbi:hypothetical protein FJTKL_10895 [Diaporthe vaccinii]|uniref:Uncharacterized protein n=1 Tax=Diaporthe vaccinii TaxID=105482 RepID=A0ABR4EIJ5_9PEZI